MSEPRKYEAPAQPGLFFWAEQVGGPVSAWMVVSEMKGYHATEAADDWMARFKDADKMAKTLAEEYEP